MIQDALIVDYDPFALESRVYTYKDGNRGQSSVYSSVEELANELVALAYQENIFYVKVNGPFMVQGQLNRLIKEQEQKEYSVNKINVGGL